MRVVFPSLLYPHKSIPMPKTSQKQTGSAYARQNSQFWIGVEAEEIPIGWMDDMTRRLFDVMNRNLIRLETAQTKVNDEGKTSDQILKEASQHARLATQIRTDLERLKKLEMKRPSRKLTAVESDDELRAGLQREFDRILAAERAASATKEPSS